LRVPVCRSGGAGFVTFRLDQAIHEAVRYSPQPTSSAFIRAAINELLKRERPSGWTVLR